MIVALVLFARRVAHLVNLTSELSGYGTTRTYTVTEELFFASSDDLYSQFDYTAAAPEIIIDLGNAHLWDASTIATLDAVTTKFNRHDRTSTSSHSTSTAPPDTPDFPDTRAGATDAALCSLTSLIATARNRGRIVRDSGRGGRRGLRDRVCLPRTR